MSKVQKMRSKADKLFDEEYFKEAHELYDSILNELDSIEFDGDSKCEIVIKFDKCYLKERKPWIEFGEENNSYKDIEIKYTEEGIRLYNLEDKFNFGQYKGKYISDILESNPEYILWATINVSWFCPHPEVLLDRNFAYMDIYLKALEHRILKLNFVESYYPVDYDAEYEYNMLFYKRPQGWEDALPPDEADIARLNTE